MNKYYFTADKWYGPVPEGLDDRYCVSEEMLQYHNYPSGRIDGRLSGWAGQVKEEGKDFMFDEIEEKEYYPNGDYTGVKFLFRTAVPIADECKHEPLIDTGIGYYHCPACNSGWEYKDQQKQMFSEEQVLGLMNWLKTLGDGFDFSPFDCFIDNLMTDKELLTEYLKKGKP